MVQVSLVSVSHDHILRNVVVKLQGSLSHLWAHWDQSIPSKLRNDKLFQTAGPVGSW